MKKNSLFKNISLIILSTLFLVLSVLGFIVNIDIKNKAREIAFADSTTTNFYGSSFYVPINTYYYDMDYTWTAKTWNGLTNANGGLIWSDGTNFYYSSNAQQYVLDLSTSTWSTKSWSGLTTFTSLHIWTDGTNYYYSNGAQQYVLDLSTSTWSTKTWNGLTTSQLNNLFGDFIWSDGSNCYYSYGSSSQFILDVSTSTWSTKSWSGLTNFRGNYIWSDGSNYYYSNGAEQYVLDLSTSTWSTKSWSGLTSFTATNIWSDGSNYYYSNGAEQYVLDLSTSTWNNMPWDVPLVIGLNNFYGQYIWSDGSNCYYSYGSSRQYILDTTKHFVKDYDNTYFTSISFSFIDNVNSYNLYANSVVYSYDTNGQVKYSVSDKFVISEHTFQQTGFDTDVAKIYDLNNYLNFISSNSSYFTSPLKVLVPFEMFNKYNVKITACFYVFIAPDNVANNFNFTSVKFGSYSDSLSNGTDEYISNFVYYSSSTWTIQIEFPCFAYSDTPVYYFADSSELITYYLGFTGQRPTNNYYFRFNERVYYFTNSVDGYDNGYDNGYKVGYDNGDNVGYERGYNTGYNTGTTDGYYNGYNAGVIAANDYTFLGLISAVIDAPIKAFTGLFNFNLLGVNMVSFITALFTLAVIVTILKKVI